MGIYIPRPPILFNGIAILVPDQVYTPGRCSLHVKNTLYVEMQHLISKEQHLVQSEVCKSQLIKAEAVTTSPNTPNPP